MPGNPQTYHVLRAHPGESRGPLVPGYDEFPADAVLHWFRPDRPGQARGIPDIMPALPLFALSVVAYRWWGAPLVRVR